MTTDTLLNLLVITWIADGKSLEQVRAFCRAAGMLDSEALAVEGEFERRRPKPADVNELRNETGASRQDVKALLCAYGGDKEVVKQALKLPYWKKPSRRVP